MSDTNDTLEATLISSNNINDIYNNNDKNHNNNNKFITMQSSNDLQLFQQLFIDNTTKYINDLLSNQCNTLNDIEKKQIITILLERIKQYGINITNTIQPYTYVDKQECYITEYIDKLIDNHNLPSSNEWSRCIEIKNNILNIINRIQYDLPQQLNQIDNIKTYLIEYNEKIQQQNNNKENMNHSNIVRNSSRLANKLASKS